ncbi:TetR/AcrR family transcriptional regulator [Shimazuella alba]|uniref:TetR family transcriptional regulator n=1 Tax=Shimazuella alba TaxID=2690964 RepID=A0A6I4VV37_9BACL|nr:TetR/AcrR family transcriptional regulator [Shimazuella alba]MXQ54408.1 TetR family transcriptional regulator [Shimazuella alba]
MLRETKKKQTKEAIMKHAIKLFKQKGYENVTVEEITIACGIAKGTFFNYFPKKEHILLHVTDTYMDLLNEIVHKHQEGTLRDRISHIFHDLLQIYLKHFDLLRFTLEETMRSAIRSETGSTNIKRFQETLSTLIEKEKNNASFPKRWESDKVAAILVGIFFHTIINWSSDVDKEKMMEMIQQQLDIVWEGIE